MVPTLQTPTNSLRANGFINAYIKDVSKETEYDDCIYLLFKPENLDKFREFLDGEYERTKNIIEDYDYEGGYVVVVYKLNDSYKKDFALIQNGAYSKTSKKFQSFFPKKIIVNKSGFNKEEISLQYRIFNKSKDLVEFWENKLGIEWKEDWEVWDNFYIEKEMLNIKEIL